MLSAFCVRKVLFNDPFFQSSNSYGIVDSSILLNIAQQLSSFVLIFLPLWQDSPLLWWSWTVVVGLKWRNVMKVTFLLPDMDQASWGTAGIGVLMKVQSLGLLQQRLQPWLQWDHHYLCLPPRMMVELQCHRRRLSLWRSTRPAVVLRNAKRVCWDSQTGRTLTDVEGAERPSLLLL